MERSDQFKLGEKLDAVLEKLLQTFNLPGIAVGIVHEGEIVYAKGFGVRDVQTQEPVTTRSLFHQASTSKVITATAIMQLVERGLICIDDPVVKYLPNFRLDDERARFISIEQMLSHSAGLPDIEDHNWKHPEYDEGSLMRYLSNFQSCRLVSDPGSKFSYSNLGFNVLGALIAEVSGELFEDYTLHHIFEPLGMVDSTFLKTEVPHTLETSPHIRAPGLEGSHIFPYSRPQAPSGALQSNVEDMCRWMLAMLSPNNRVLEHSRNLWKPRAQTGYEDSLQTEIGLGWFIGEYKGMPTIMHDGGDVGYETELLIFKEEPLAVTLMSNVFPAGTSSILQVILDIVFGFYVQMPKQPILIPLMAMMAETGLESAITQFHLMDRDAYDTDITFLRDSVFILNEAHRSEAAGELLKLGAYIYPKNEIFGEV